MRPMKKNGVRIDDSFAELIRKLDSRTEAASTPVRTKEKDKIIRALRRLK